MLRDEPNRLLLLLTYYCCHELRIFVTVKLIFYNRTW